MHLKWRTHHGVLEQPNRAIEVACREYALRIRRTYGRNIELLLGAIDALDGKAKRTRPRRPIQVLDDGTGDVLLLDDVDVLDLIRRGVDDEVHIVGAPIQVNERTLETEVYELLLAQLRTRLDFPDL